MITLIKTPAHFASADAADIQRELIGLVIEANALPYDATVKVEGVKAAGARYGTPYATVKHSRAVRSGRVIEVKWS